MRRDMGGNSGSKASPQARSGLGPTGYDPGRIEEAERAAETDFLDGYRDGRDPSSPEPSDNRSEAYKHSFEVGRAEIAEKPLTAVLSRHNAQMIMTAERVRAITGGLPLEAKGRP